MNLNRSGRAFTLVELLVVITIVAILLAMLMPAMAKAKQTAHQVMCAGNMRQLAVAVANYNASASEGYRLAIDTNGYRQMEWMRLLLPYVGDPTGSSWVAYWNGSNPSLGPVSEASLLCFRRNKMFICPSNAGVHPGVPWGAGAGYYWNSYAPLQITFVWSTASSVGQANWTDLRTDWTMPAGSPVAYRAKEPIGLSRYVLFTEAYSGVQRDGVNEMYVSNQQTARGPQWHELHNGVTNLLSESGAVKGQVFRVSDTGNYWESNTLINTPLSQPMW